MRENSSAVPSNGTCSTEEILAGNKDNAVIDSSSSGGSSGPSGVADISVSTSDSIYRLRSIIIETERRRSEVPDTDNRVTDTKGVDECGLFNDGCALPEYKRT